MSSLQVRADKDMQGTSHWIIVSANGQLLILVWSLPSGPVVVDCEVCFLIVLGCRGCFCWTVAVGKSAWSFSLQFPKAY